MYFHLYTSGRVIKTFTPIKVNFLDVFLYYRNDDPFIGLNLKKRQLWELKANLSLSCSNYVCVDEPAYEKRKIRRSPSIKHRVRRATR